MASLWRSSSQALQLLQAVLGHGISLIPLASPETSLVRLANISLPWSLRFKNTCKSRLLTVYRANLLRFGGLWVYILLPLLVTAAMRTTASTSTSNCRRSDHGAPHIILALTYLDPSCPSLPKCEPVLPSPGPPVGGKPSPPVLELK